MARVAPPPRVLVADGDLFQGGYVTAALEARGMEVVGPLADHDEVMLAVHREPGLCAAVIGLNEPRALTPDLALALHRRGLPCLVLAPHVQPTRAQGMPQGTPLPILAPPFAAYQVVDWVSGLTAKSGPDAVSPLEYVVG